MGAGKSDIAKDHPWIVVVCHLGMALETLAFAQSKVHLLRLFEIGAALLIMTYSLIVTQDPLDCHALWSFFHLSLNVYKLGYAYYKLWSQMRKLEPWDMLCREWFFSSFTDQEFLALREHWEWVLLQSGDVLIEEGEEVTHMSMIFQGQAEIRIENKNSVLAQLGPGSWIGEMAFFTGELASATVCASKTTLVIRWKIDEIKKLLSQGGRSYKSQAFAKLPSHFCADLAKKVKQYNSLPAMRSFLKSQRDREKSQTRNIKRFGDRGGQQRQEVGGFAKLASVRKSWIGMFNEDGTDRNMKNVKELYGDVDEDEERDKFEDMRAVFPAKSKGSKKPTRMVSKAYGFGKSPTVSKQIHSVSFNIDSSDALPGQVEDKGSLGDISTPVKTFNGAESDESPSPPGGPLSRGGENGGDDATDNV